MAIRYTSRVSFGSIIDDLTGLRLEVYQAIAAWNMNLHGPGPTIEDLADLLNRKR